MPGRAAGRFLAMSSGPFMLGTREAWPDMMPAASVVDVARPTPAEQRAAWLAALSPGAEQTADRLTGQFDFDAATIRDVARSAAGSGDGPAPEGRLPQLWDACTAICRPRMDALAQPIESRVGTWEDLVLPGSELSLLHRIATRSATAPWCTTAGDSPTGSTGAWESPRCSPAPRHRQDHGRRGARRRPRPRALRDRPVARVVSKYIGETEKNLRRVFDAAEEAAAVLLFDEADALFGKRTEVKDGHDRYANIEINYLLQRMEYYRGVAILATNMQPGLDHGLPAPAALRAHVPVPRRDRAPRDLVKGVPAADPDGQARPGPARRAHRHRRNDQQHRTQRGLPRRPRRGGREGNGASSSRIEASVP